MVYKRKIMEKPWPSAVTKIVITEEQLQRRIRELGSQIAQYYRGKDLFILSILKGAVIFTADLIRHIEEPIMVDFITLSSYKGTTGSVGEVTVVKGLESSIKGKDLLIIDDVLDTGQTLHHLMQLLSKEEPKSLKVCTLLLKKKRRAVNIEVDYFGFEIENIFVVGYGMDYMQRYRNLPYFGVME